MGVRSRDADGAGDNFRLTPRDLDMLHSLGQARYLSIDALEWLHFPVWRERYAAWQKTQSAGNQQRYMSSSHAYRRLRWLLREKWVRRLRRPTALAIEVFGREPDLYYLTEQGARLLSEYRGLDLEALHYGDPRQRSYQKLQHHEAVGRVYAALRSKIESRPDLRFEDWRSEHDFQRDFDHVPVWIPASDGTSHIEETGLQPDGAFFIKHTGGRALLFVEVERDQPLPKWRKKIWAYEAYYGSEQLKTRFGTGDFIFLGIGLNEGHQQRLVQATGEALALLYTDPHVIEAAMDRYRLGHMAMVHPLTIGTGWEALTTTQVKEQSGVVPWRITVQSQLYELIG
jgi:hypothetical protein